MATLVYVHQCLITRLTNSDGSLTQEFETITLECEKCIEQLLDSYFVPNVSLKIASFELSMHYINETFVFNYVYVIDYRL